MVATHNGYQEVRYQISEIILERFSFFFWTKKGVIELTCLCCIGFLKDNTLLLKTSKAELNTSCMPPHGGGYVLKNSGIHVMSPGISSPNFRVEFLDAWDDEYDGVIIDPNSLPSSANAFVSALQASLSNWKLKV